MIINYQDKLGLTPLHRLLIKDFKKELIMLLADYGCGFNIPDKRGWNVLQLFLHSVAFQKPNTENLKQNIEILNMLIENKCLINQKDQKGWTAIHRAANFGYDDLLEILIKNGGQVNTLDNRGSSALHKASRNGMIRCVRILLKYGADLSAVDTSGNTPLSLARLYDQSQVVLVLDPNIKSNNSMLPITFNYDDNYLDLEKKLLKYNPNYYQYTVLLLGSVKCGKTKLIQRIKTKIFSQTYLPTIEKKTPFNAIYSNKRVIINILDVSGDQIYSSFREGWIKKADGFILCYSVDENPENLQTLKIYSKLINHLKKSDNDDYKLNNNNNKNNKNNENNKNNGNNKNNKNNENGNVNGNRNGNGNNMGNGHASKIPLLLVSLKNDLKEKMITEEQGVELSNDIKCPFIQVSSKLNLNVDSAFKNIIIQLINKIPNRETKINNPISQRKNKNKPKKKKNSFYRKNKTVLQKHIRIKSTEINSFGDVLKNEMCLDWFFKFLEREYAQENLTFYYTIQQYKKITHTDPQLAKVVAKNIAEKYIVNGAKEQININFEERKKIENILETKRDIDSKLFDQALIQVLHLLKTDSYPKFIQTSFFKQMKEEIEKSNCL